MIAKIENLLADPSDTSVAELLSKEKKALAKLLRYKISRG